MRVALLDDYQGVAKLMTDWNALSPSAEVTAFKDHITDEAALVQQLKGYDVAVCMRERTPFHKSVLAKLPNLKLLVTTGMANAAFDIDAATELGITVAGTGGTGDTTGELTWGLLLALTRHIAEEDRATRGGGWQTTIGPGLKGKTLGLLGLGRIGSEMARFAHAFQMPVIAWSQNLTKERAVECGATLVAKDELFAKADIISIHLRLSERTRNLVTARELAMMKPTAYLINTSRGPIVTETALIDALRRQAIAGAAMDVFDQEPLPQDHPLRGLKNTVITPHLGYVTTEAYATMYSNAVENIRAFEAGEAIRVLNPAVRQRANLRRL